MTTRAPTPNGLVTPTRRGWGVLLIIGFCLLMAWSYGTRSLGAIIIPLGVGLLAGVISVARTARPTVTRTPIADGFPGEQRTVTLNLEFGSGRPTGPTVADTVGAGVEGVESAGQAVEGRYQYELTLRERGVCELGPVTVTVRDVFDLVKQRFRVSSLQSVLVYPTVYSLRDEVALVGELHEQGGGTDREFDHLRAYERGDQVRDIHWKATAKRADTDLVVKQFVTDASAQVVELAAGSETEPDAVDGMATAAASLSLWLLEAGVDVGVRTPDGHCQADSGDGHKQALLRLLGSTTGGELPADAEKEAGVLIWAESEETIVQVGDRKQPFSRFVPEGDTTQTRRPITPTPRGVNTQ